MKKRIVIKIGDIFCVEIDNKFKCYFQYIATDMTVLNSSVIRVFKKRYQIDYLPILDEIVKDEVYFYAHTILRFGLINNAWYKIGKHNNLGNINDIWFKMYNDIGNPNMIKSYRWVIWKIDQKQQLIGELTDNYKHIDLGIVLTYEDIVSKIATGDFLLKHID